ncbi:hypothetical protein D3P08_13910 [Paenibacillus nanensis]|uniref:Damage-inducible protein DinB n=1 Tax=Paenibacillus nanensis TaxID=393251 RepID=A0A3A1UU58_9BACL|nr:DinB family protein [Paenibacillus nanensis]RIX52069.1 hypothetical protein D3P08_13910 [Paenibacillus nanensis]
MYPSVQAFLEEWKEEAEKTKAVLDSLTDVSLSYQAVPNQRTIGRVAWHLVTSIEEFMAPAGAKLGVAIAMDRVPATAAEISRAYAELCDAALPVVSEWTDSALQETANFFGQEWVVGYGMRAMVNHEIHHRGQLTVLMRQAGIKPPIIYGPAKEDWAAFGMAEPVV